MKAIRKKQSGMTFLGVCIVLGIIASYVLIALTAFPLYNEYFGLQTVMKSVAQIPKDKSDREIIRAFVKNADINSLNRFGEAGIRDDKELVIIEKDKKTRKKTLIVTYQAASNLFSNLNLMLDVKESILLGEGATSTVSLYGGDDTNK